MFLVEHVTEMRFNILVRLLVASDPCFHSKAKVEQNELFLIPSGFIYVIHITFKEPDS